MPRSDWVSGNPVKVSLFFTTFSMNATCISHMPTFNHSVLCTERLDSTNYYSTFYLPCTPVWLSVYLLCVHKLELHLNFSEHALISPRRYSDIYQGLRSWCSLAKESILCSGEKGGRGGPHEDFSRPQYLWNSSFQKHHGVYPYIFHCACSQRQWELFMWSKKRGR